MYAARYVAENSRWAFSGVAITRWVKDKSSNQRIRLVIGQLSTIVQTFICLLARAIPGEERHRRCHYLVPLHFFLAKRVRIVWRYDVNETCRKSRQPRPDHSSHQTHSCRIRPRSENNLQGRAATWVNRRKVLSRNNPFTISSDISQKYKDVRSTRDLRTEASARGIITKGVNYGVNRAITYARWGVRGRERERERGREIHSGSEKQKRTACRSEGKGGGGTLATNGIDWKDDAPGWRLVSGLGERERRTHGWGGSRIGGFRRHMKQRGERTSERGWGQGGAEGC